VLAGVGQKQRPRIGTEGIRGLSMGITGENIGTPGNIKKSGGSEIVEPCMKIK
jgi:hypothetical protein